MEVKLLELTMQFDDTKAVDQLSATINDGELVSLLGPSGCGKSTTLMMLAGLYKPTSGKIYFGNQDVTNVDAEKRGIGMVFQNYALYPHLNTLKNIMFPLKMQKVPKKEAIERAMEMAKLVQIDHLLDRKPGQLSGGQQQRVAIARALVKNPQILLLDEPLSNLDARLRLEMREEIRRIQQEIGITAIFVTHDQEEALSISDRVLLLKDGVLQQNSKPQEMYKKPCNRFVASFLGSPPINLLTVTKANDNGDYRLENSETIVALGKMKKLHAEKLDIGLRPENLYLTTLEDSLLQGEITHIETIGRDVLIRVGLNESTSIRALVNPELDLMIRSRCYLGIKPNNIHFFDRNTGKHI